MGDPHQPDTVIGPLVEAKQCPFIKGQVDEAVEGGARLLYGGNYDGGFFQPTVVADVRPEMRLFQEESFGPVVCVVRAPTARRHWPSPTTRPSGSLRASSATTCRRRWIFHCGWRRAWCTSTTAALAEPHVPFGGVKESGVGREGGHYSIEEMTEIKWITIQLDRRNFPF